MTRPNSMKFEFNPEHVTFGGGGLDRADHLRGDPAQQADLWARARVVLVWRGKVLADEGGLRLLESNHPALDAEHIRLFLGLEGANPVFACELTDWQPTDAPGAIDSFADRSVQRHDAIADAGFHDLRAVMTRLTPFEAELAATARAIFQWHAGNSFCRRCGSRSAPANAGWQRRCEGCGAPEFPRTDPVVITLVTMGDSLLLGRSHGWPEGMFSLLAGFVEPGETIEAAARREVWEETGIRTSTVRYLASQPWPFPHSLMIGCWSEAITRDITLDKTELDDARWVSRAELAQAFAGTHPDIWPARNGSIARFLMDHWLHGRVAL